MKGGNNVRRLREKMKLLDDASDGVVELPDDLIYLIFLKLPNKSLVRFLILSKQWKEAITSRKFFMHQKKTNPEERLVTNIFVHKISTSDRSLYAQRIWGNHCQYRRVLVVSNPVHLWLSATTRDGLIGIVHTKDIDIYSFVIWNPYTGQKKEVSLPRGYGPYGNGYESVYCSVEFGFDATIHDYKIILIFRDFSLSSEYYVNKIMIRALRSSEQWRTVYCASSSDSSIIEMYDVVVIDGDVWWIAKISTIDHDECDKSFVLIKLSLAEEKLSTVALLPGDIDSDKYWNKFHLRHHDELIYFIDSQLDSEYRIWRFIKQTEAWELAYVVQKPKNFLFPVGFTSNGTFIMRDILDNIFHAYVPGEKSFFTINFRRNLYSRMFDEYYLSQTETLISP